MDFWAEGLWRSFILVAVIILHLPNFGGASSYYEAPLHYRQHALDATDLPCGSDVQVKAGEKFLFDSASAIVYESSQYASSSYSSTRRKRAAIQEQKPNANLNTQDGPTSMKLNILQGRNQAQGRSYSHGGGGSTYGAHSYSSSGSGGTAYKGHGGGEKHYGGGGGGGGYGHSIKPSVCQWTYSASEDCSLEMHIIRFKPGDLNCYKQEFSVSDDHTEYKLCGYRKLYPGFRAESPVLHIKYWRLPYTYRHVFKGYVTCVGRAQNPTFDDSAQYYLPTDAKGKSEGKTIEAHENADTTGSSHTVNQFIAEHGLTKKKPSKVGQAHPAQQALAAHFSTEVPVDATTEGFSPTEGPSATDSMIESTTENLEKPGDENFEKPGDSATENVENPAGDPATENLENPGDLATENVEKPGDSATENVENPGDSATENVENPGDSAIKNLEKSEDPATENLENPGDSATKNLEKPGDSATKDSPGEGPSSEEESSSKQSESEEYASKENQYGYGGDGGDESEETFVEKKALNKNLGHGEAAEGDHKTAEDLVQQSAPEPKAAVVVEDEVNTSDNAEEETPVRAEVEENVMEETADTEIEQNGPDQEVTFAGQNLSPAGRSYENNPVDPYSYNVPQSGTSSANPFLVPQSQYYGYPYQTVMYIPVPPQTYPYYGQTFEGGSIDQNPPLIPASPSAYENPYTIPNIIPNIQAPTSPSYSYVGGNYPPSGPLTGILETTHGYNVQQPLSSLNYNPVIPPYIQNIPADLSPYPKLPIEPAYSYQSPPPRPPPQGPLPVPLPNEPSYNFEYPQTFPQPQPPPSYQSIPAPQFSIDQTRGYGVPPIQGPVNPSYTYLSPASDGPILVPDYNSGQYTEEVSYPQPQPYPPQPNYPIEYPAEYRSKSPAPHPQPPHPISHPVQPSPPQLNGYDYPMSSATDPNVKYIVKCDLPYPQPCTPLSITPINGQLQQTQSSPYNYQPKQQSVMHGR